MGDAPIHDATQDDGPDPADSGPTSWFVTGDLAGETQFAAHGILAISPGNTRTTLPGRPPPVMWARA